MKPDDARPAGDGTAPIWAHVIPFVAWLFIFQMLGDPAGWKYAVRTALCLGLFLWFRPWRWYEPLKLRHLPLALAVGVGVFLVWVAGESDWASRWPALQELYLRVGCWPPWEVTERKVSLAYAPEVCGWPLTAVRILGSAFVIGIIEEFFWRGFLYRWLLAKDFLKVDLGRMDVPMFLMVALVFGAEHVEWLAGVAAGLAYGWMLIRTRDIWAVSLAHAITNLLLGLYVIWADKWQFWA